MFLSYNIQIFVRLESTVNGCSCDCLLLYCQALLNKMDFNIHGEQFLSLVQQQNLLWNKKNENFKNTRLKNIIWSQIGEVFGLTGEQASNAFVSIRQKYIREKEKLNTSTRSGAPGGKPTKPWFLMDMMRFLDSVIVPRKTHSSLSINNEQLSQQSFVSIVENLEQNSLRNSYLQNVYAHSLSPSTSSHSSELLSPIPTSSLAVPELCHNLEFANCAAIPSTPTTKPSSSTELHVPNQENILKRPATEQPVNSPVSKKRRKKLEDVNMSTILSALEAPLKVEESTWNVKNDVKYFCMFLGSKLDKLSDEVRQNLENDILKKVYDSILNEDNK